MFDSMKAPISKFLMFVAFALMMTCVAASAQDAEAILSKIESKAPQNISGKFTEVRIAAGASESAGEKLSGDLVFKTEGYLSMDYTNGEQFVIDGSSVKITRAGKTQVFDASKNMMMKGLSHMLVYAFQGKAKLLSQEQKTTLLVNKEGDEYVVILAAQAKAARGYSRAVFRYDASTCRIRTMELVEFSGAVTRYAL